MLINFVYRPITNHLRTAHQGANKPTQCVELFVKPSWTIAPFLPFIMRPIYCSTCSVSWNISFFAYTIENLCSNLENERTMQSSTKRRGRDCITINFRVPYMNCFFFVISSHNEFGITLNLLFSSLRVQNSSKSFCITISNTRC